MFSYYAGYFGRGSIVLRKKMLFRGRIRLSKLTKHERGLLQNTLKAHFSEASASPDKGTLNTLNAFMRSVVPPSAMMANSPKAKATTPAKPKTSKQGPLAALTDQDVLKMVLGDFFFSRDHYASILHEGGIHLFIPFGSGSDFSSPNDLRLVALQLTVLWTAFLPTPRGVGRPFFVFFSFFPSSKWRWS